MAHLAAVIVSSDEAFRRQLAGMLRLGSVPITVAEDNRTSFELTPPDLALVDIRGDLATGVAAIERLRASAASVSIFAIAAATDPELILHAMRAGANEFFVWPAPEDAFHAAIRRTAGRRDVSQGGSRPASVTLVFVGAKGGAGTTTVAVNCAVELARLTRRPTIAVDLKACLGEVALFLGVRPRFTLLDAIENLHRLDREFLRELVARHKSGLEVLAGSDQFDRPGGADAGALEELLRLLTRLYDFIVVDAGNSINACTLAALYAGDTVFLVTNPDVPSVRNAQRLMDRMRQLGAGGERVRILLNRASEPFMVTPKQIERALGYPIHHSFLSDYKVVSTALNSGVPLALTNHSELAAQFDRFTRQIIAPADVAATVEAPKRRKFLSLLS